MKFIEKANLPEDAKTIVIGEKYSELLAKPLEKLGIEVLFVPDNPRVDKRLAGHADLSLIHLGGNKIALAPYLKGSGFAEHLYRLGFEIMFPGTLVSAAGSICFLLGSCLFLIVQLV